MSRFCVFTLPGPEYDRQSDMMTVRQFVLVCWLATGRTRLLPRSRLIALSDFIRRLGLAKSLSIDFGALYGY